MENTHSIRNQKILIVDDHKNIRVSLRLTLEGEQAHVEEAENFSQASQVIDPMLGDPSNFPFPWCF